MTGILGKGLALEITHLNHIQRKRMVILRRSEHQKIFSHLPGANLVVHHIIAYTLQTDLGNDQKKSPSDGRQLSLFQKVVVPHKGILWSFSRTLTHNLTILVMLTVRMNITVAHVQC